MKNTSKVLGIGIGIGLFLGFLSGGIVVEHMLWSGNRKLERFLLVSDSFLSKIDRLFR